MFIDVVHRTNAAILLFLLTPLNVMAEDTASSTQSTGVRSTSIATDHMSSGYLAQLVVGLLFVLLCIVVLAWLAKRFNRLQSSSYGALQVLGGISMGARERVVLVQVGTTQLLLGVAPGRINMLHQLEQPLEPAGDDVGDRSGRSFGITCQLRPKRSMHQPHRLSAPPSAISAAQSRSVSA